MSPVNGGQARPVCLAVDDNGQIIALPSPAKVYTDSEGNDHPVDPDLYEKELKQQQWICECIEKGPDVKKDDNSYVLGGTFTLYSRYKNQYLVVAAPGGVRLGGIPEGWFLNLEPVGPGPFSYKPDPWSIYTTSRDESTVPRCDAPGSQPMTWAISPSLTSGLEIIQTGIFAGSIAISDGRTANQVAKKTYTVTASLEKGGKKLSATSTVSIEVLVPDQ
jgi:hypothetical protein